MNLKVIVVVVLVLCVCSQAVFAARITKPFTKSGYTYHAENSAIKNSAVNNSARALGTVLVAPFVVVCLPFILTKVDYEIKHPEARARTSLLIDDLTDPRLFESDKELKSLPQILLKSNKRNAGVLKTLAQRSPRLQTLILEQSEPLSHEEMEGISKIEHLKVLMLSCPIPDTRLFELLPKTLETLSLANCVLDQNWLVKLDVPQLAHLSMTSVEMPVGSLKDISRLRSLTSLVILKSNIDDSELQYLMPLEYLRINIDPL